MAANYFPIKDGGVIKDWESMDSVQIRQNARELLQRIAEKKLYVNVMAEENKLTMRMPSLATSVVSSCFSFDDEEIFYEASASTDNTSNNCSHSPAPDGTTNNPMSSISRSMMHHPIIRCLLFVISLSLLPRRISCRSAVFREPVSLTDKTFDNVREAFDYPNMLILSHSSKNSNKNDDHLFFAQRSDQIKEEFRKLSQDQLLQDQDIMLVTVDSTQNRMLAARMGVPMNELPSLVYLYNDHIFQYQGDLTSSELMRSYALQGFHNQGQGELMLHSSYWLLIKTTYMDWLFNGAGNAAALNINITALVVSAFVVGLGFCGMIALVVSISFKGGEDDAKKGATGKIMKKKKKKQ